jgi:thiamine pyrophosphokinase
MNGTMEAKENVRTAHTVILADGERPSHGVPLALLRSAARVFACDGAWRTAVALGRTPDAVVGDGDSLAVGDLRELERLGVPVVRDPEQDTNDLCKAFRHALRTAGRGRICILGATGKREDHTIGNVFHLIDFALENPDVSIVTDSGVFEPVMPPCRCWDAASGTEAPVSVFAPHPGTAMESEGLKWPLGGVKFDSLWRGTLNRIVSPRFSIRTDRPAIVFRPH